MYIKEIGLCIQNLLIILGLMVNIIGFGGNAIVYEFEPTCGQLFVMSRKNNSQAYQSLRQTNLEKQKSHACTCTREPPFDRGLPLCTTPFMLISVTCVIVSLTPVMRPMLGSNNGQQLDHSCNLVTLVVSVFTNVSHIHVLKNIYEVYAQVTQ